MTAMYEAVGFTIFKRVNEGCVLVTNIGFMGTLQLATTFQKLRDMINRKSGMKTRLSAKSKGLYSLMYLHLEERSDLYGFNRKRNTTR